MNFTGKRVVVTGAGTGIGAATAARFLDLGAEVIATQNRSPAPRATSRISLDLGSEESIAAACDALPREFDILCNVAGLDADRGTAAEVINVNFIGTRMFTERLLDRISPAGAVLNVSSTAGRHWRLHLEHARQILAMRSMAEVAPWWEAQQLEHQMCYTLSKELVVLWTMLMAKEHVHVGPRFNAILPGFTDTPMLRGALEKANPTVRGLLLANNPKFSPPEDVAELIAMVCSDAARVLNGAEILADCGLSASTNCRDFGVL